jgi:hypothetical protein
MANYILFDDALYYNAFGDILGAEHIEQLIEQQKFYKNLSYLLIPLILLIRPFYTATCLVTGAVLSEQKLKFKQSFNIALKADAVFLLEVMIRIIYLSIVGTNSLQEIGIPLFSVLQWLGVDNVAPYLSYPLGILSVFELIYWILLSIFISIHTKKKFWSSFYFVLSTYGIGLLLLVIAVIYIVALIF